MKRIGAFTLYKDKETLEFIEKNIQNRVEKYSIENGHMKIRVDSCSPVYNYLFSIMREDNKPQDIYNEVRIYTKKEMETATYFELYLSAPWELDGKLESDFNTDYDMGNTCPKCGRGKQLKSDLYVQGSKLKNKELAMLPPSIIISSRVKRIIEEYELEGCEFGTVRDYRSKKIIDFHRLIVKNILPPLDQTVRFKQWKPSYCDVCHRYDQSLESEIIYKENQLDLFKDFNLTQEYFLMSWSMRKLIISKKVREVFKNEHIKMLHCEPVSFIR